MRSFDVDQLYFWGAVISVNSKTLIRVTHVRCWGKKKCKQCF